MPPSACKHRRQAHPAATNLTHCERPRQKPTESLDLAHSSASVFSHSPRTSSEPGSGGVQGQELLPNGHADAAASLRPPAGRPGAASAQPGRLAAASARAITATKAFMSATRAALRPQELAISTVRRRGVWRAAPNGLAVALRVSGGRASMNGATASGGGHRRRRGCSLPPARLAAAVL